MIARPGLADIFAAQKAIANVTSQTPLVLSALSDQVGAPVWLKLETLHPTGAFKLRGAVNAIARLIDAERKRGVVCCSTGNHGRALAYAAREKGVQATVCLSSLVPEVKVRAVEALGARVVRVGRSQDEARHEADRLVMIDGLINIPPFDHPDIVAGQGTIAVELMRERPELETILVPLSGGGLTAGIAIASKAIKPSVRVIGISMDRGAAMAESLKADRPVEVEEVLSLADSLGGGIGRDNRLTFATCRDLVDDVVLLSEDEIYQGMQALFFEDRLVAEGAAAVGHGAILAGKLTLSGPTAIVLSGRNVDMTQFSDVVNGKPIHLGERTVGEN